MGKIKNFNIIHKKCFKNIFLLLIFINITLLFYLTLLNISKLIYANKLEKRSSIMTQTEIEKLIQIQNYNDIIIKRNNLIKDIWKTNNFPKNKLPSISKNVIDEKLKNVKIIDRLLIKMDYNINSIAYHFQPIQKKQFNNPPSRTFRRFLPWI